MADELRATVRRCLDRSAGPRPHLAGEPGTGAPHDVELWRVLGAEVGIAGLLVPEHLGGAGGSVADLAVVAEELGRALAPVPFFSTVVLATTALLEHVDEPVADELLGRIAKADITATLGVGAVTEYEGRLTGRLEHVVDAATADVVLVRTGERLFAVGARAPGLERATMQGLDLTRPLGPVVLTDTPALSVGDKVFDTGADVALVLMAVEHVGGAQRCLDEAVAYAKQRVQFDRPIGSFQAIKHRLVDALLATEMARSAAAGAVRAADAHLACPDDDTAARLALLASLAKARCAEAYLHVAEETLHVHGGVGFTWEHDAHLHFRRAKSGELLFGTPHQHRERLATQAGLG